MSVSSKHEPVLVVAFDFGTTFSGYAYCFTIKEDEIFLNEKWEGIDSFKTNTSVLIDQYGRCDSFGYYAEEKYATLQLERQMSYDLFDKFKMTLDKDNLWGEPVTVTSRNGKEKDGIEIFAFALKSMRDRLIKDITSRHRSYSRKIRWVITVPAIWSEGAKQFMRKVAKRAGLIQELNSPELVIALEPEAASIYFRNLVIHKFDPETQGRTISEGADYVILDCGGGTIDVAAHRVIDKEHVKEIYRATGGPWGGMNVNTNFEKLIRKILGNEFIEHLRKTQPKTWFTFLNDFERSKRMIGDIEVIRIPIGYQMGTEFDAFCSRYRRNVCNIMDAFSMSLTNNIFYEKGEVVIAGDALRSLFTPVVNKIINHMEHLLKQELLQKVTHIILIGGFSKSPYLKKVLMDQFQTRYRVLPAEGAEIAVLKGAVLYGINPPVIQSRIARFTYGYDVDSEFKSYHDKSRKYFDKYTQKYYCRDCFHVLINQGESVDFGEVRTGFAKPSTPDQTLITYKFLAIAKANVTYGDEDGVMELGRLTLTSKNTRKGLDRKFQCHFIFGGTELDVHVTQVGDNNAEVHATFALCENYT